MTPKSAVSHAFRDAVLMLAAKFPFARPLVNSGRLSTAIAYPDSPLNTTDAPGDHWQGIAPGHKLLDAWTAAGWLLERTRNAFSLLAWGWQDAVPSGVTLVELKDEPAAIERLDLRPGSAILIRPDQYVAGRWRSPNADVVATAAARAKGLI